LANCGKSVDAENTAAISEFVVNFLRCHGKEIELLFERTLKQSA
jgi:hypothetical protein